MGWAMLPLRYGDVRQPHLVDATFEIPGMVKKPVLYVRLIRLAHVDEVRSDAPGHRRYKGDNVAPQIGGCAAIEKSL